MTRNQKQYLSGLADSKFKVILHGHVPVCDGHPFPAVQSVGITSGPGAIGGLSAPFRADKAASQNGFSEQIDQVVGVQQQFLKVRSALFRPDLDATGAAVPQQLQDLSRRVQRTLGNSPVGAGRVRQCPRILTYDLITYHYGKSIRNFFKSVFQHS